MNADKRRYVAANLRSSVFICGFVFLYVLRLFSNFTVELKISNLVLIIHFFPDGACADKRIPERYPVIAGVFIHTFDKMYLISQANFDLADIRRRT